MLDHLFDFDNLFFREVSVALAKTWSRQLRWINRFTPTDQYPTGKRRVVVPFFTSLTGEERFVLDLFIDDIADVRVQQDTTQFQRGIITFTSLGSRDDEFANPNQYLAQKAQINDQMRRVISKVKAVPVNLNFDIDIKLASDDEVSKCSQKILDVFYNYMFFNFDFYGIKVDAVMILPADKNIEIPHEITDLTGDRSRHIKFGLTIRTYYPIFKISTDDLEICDNDDELDWDALGVPRPTTDFVQSLKAYNYAHGQIGRAGGVITGVTFDDGSTGNTWGIQVPEGIGEIRRVYWDAYFQNYQNLMYQKPYDYPFPREDFNQAPFDPPEPPLNL